MGKREGRGEEGKGSGEGKKGSVGGNERNIFDGFCISSCYYG